MGAEGQLLTPGAGRQQSPIYTQHKLLHNSHTIATFCTCKNSFEPSCPKHFLIVRGIVEFRFKSGRLIYEFVYFAKWM